MNTKIHIINYNDSFKIVKYNEIIKSNGTNCIRVNHYDDNNDECYSELIPITIKETFLVITKGEFILNDSDSSNLNSYYMKDGHTINRLGYSYSVVVMRNPTSSNIWSSDSIYSEAGIKALNSICIHIMLMNLYKDIQKVD